MNRYAILSEGFEHLSYPLGNNPSSHAQRFSDNHQSFIVHRATSEEHAKMVVGASDFLSEHCALPVGYAGSEEGEIFLVSKFSGKSPDAKAFTGEERQEFSLAVMKRLASLHAEGFGCGGISPDAVDYSGKEAKLLNPSSVFALSESDSIFYEAVATLRALAGKGFAKRGELERLAGAYLAHSPACRSGVAAHLSRKKANRHRHAAALAAHARRVMAYF